jgi:diaminopimelate epimerase
MNNNSAIKQNEDETDHQDVEKIGGRALLTKGFNFKFNTEGHEVHAWGSAKSGKEKVYVDGKLVSSKWSFTKKSLHTFTVNNISYELEFNMVSLLTGELHCILIRKGVHVETQKQVAKFTANKRLMKWRIFLWFVIGFAFGFFGIDRIMSIFA